MRIARTASHSRRLYALPGTGSSCRRARRCGEKCGGAREAARRRAGGGAGVSGGAGEGARTRSNGRFTRVVNRKAASPSSATPRLDCVPTRRRTRARRAPCGPRAAAPRARRTGRATRGSAAGLGGASSAAPRRWRRMRRTTLSASVLCESLARSAAVLSACRFALQGHDALQLLASILHAASARDC